MAVSRTIRGPVASYQPTTPLNFSLSVGQTPTSATMNNKSLSLKQICVSSENIQVSVVKRDAVIYAAELEINSLPSSVCETLIRGQFHCQLGSLTGAHITVKGKYFSSEQKANFTSTGRSLPFRALYLDITAQNINSVEAALNLLSTAITTAMQSHSPKQSCSVAPPVSAQSSGQMPPTTICPDPIASPGVRMNHNHAISFSHKATNLLPQPAFLQPPTRPTLSAIQSVAESQLISVQPFEDRLLVGINNVPPTFNLVNKLRGLNNVNVNYIEAESGSEISLRGRGSAKGHDAITDTDSNLPLHFLIRAKDQVCLSSGKQLLKSLIETTRRELSEHMGIVNEAAPWHP